MRHPTRLLMPLTTATVLASLTSCAQDTAEADATPAATSSPTTATEPSQQTGKDPAELGIDITQHDMTLVGDVVVDQVVADLITTESQTELEATVTDYFTDVPWNGADILARNPDKSTHMRLKDRFTPEGWQAILDVVQGVREEKEYGGEQFDNLQALTGYGLTRKAVYGDAATVRLDPTVTNLTITKAPYAHAVLAEGDFTITMWLSESAMENNAEGGHTKKEKEATAVQLAATNRVWFYRPPGAEDWKAYNWQSMGAKVKYLNLAGHPLL